MSVDRPTTRREDRFSINSMVLPFLGSRDEDFQPFQYVVRDLSRGGVAVAIPRWVVSRELLHVGDMVNFHVPFLLDGRVLVSGRVAWQRWDEELDAQLLGADLSSGAAAQYPVYISIGSESLEVDLTRFSGLEGLLGQVLRDSVLLKRGILIYLRHLDAYFSRVGDFEEEDYDYFREHIIEDVRARVTANLEALAALMNAVDADGGKRTVAEMVDLDELRTHMEPEIYMDLFSSALGMKTSRMYLNAIKQLEKKMYSNYNTIVLLYIQSF